MESFFKEESNTNSLAYDDVLELIKGKLKLNSASEFEAYCLTIGSSLSAFEREFGSPMSSINADNLNNAIEQIIPQIFAEASPCEHPWKYRFCAGGRAIEGAGIMAACLSIAGASAGTLTPASAACCAGAVTWLANALNECEKTWC